MTYAEEMQLNRLLRMQLPVLPAGCSPLRAQEKLSQELPSVRRNHGG